MVKEVSAYDRAWAGVFEKYDLARVIKEQGFADVTADQLREFREPRLLTKMDHSHQVPTVFEEHEVNILTRGISTFRIGAFEVFAELPEWTIPSTEVENLTLPDYIETLDVKNVTGEPAVINAAHASGLMAHFCGEEVDLTVSGRMRTGDFTFSVNNKVTGTSEIPVSKAQIEIDSAFEGRTAFTIVEVKNHISRDFCVRQIYYPYRTWLDRIQKPIRNVFLTQALGVYDIFEFEFINPLDYSSGELINHKRYTIGITRPAEADIVQRARKVIESPQAPTPEGTPFPQADDFERVMDLVSYLAEEPRTVEDLAVNYGFDPRQSDYYYNAAKYLGLAETSRGEDGREYRQATALAVEILALDYREKNLRFAELALGIKPVALTYYEWIRTKNRPSLDWTVETFAKSLEGRDLAESTQRRRSQTILSWAGWLCGIAAPER